MSHDAVSSKDEKVSEKDGFVFLGARVHKETKQRVRKATARMELEKGEFYGMSSLVELALGLGLDLLENFNANDSCEIVKALIEEAKSNG